MFKLEPKPTFIVPVDIHVPGEGKGKINAEFLFLDKDTRDEYVSGLKDKSNLEALAEIMVGWSEIDAPFTPDNLKKLLNTYSTSSTALFEAFFNELSGAPVKN